MRHYDVMEGDKRYRLLAAALMLKDAMVDQVIEQLHYEHRPWSILYDAYVEVRRELKEAL